MECKPVHSLENSEPTSSTTDQSAQYWKNLAEQRGQLMHDMMDKWSERRVEFVKAKRSMGQKLFEFGTRERILTRRIQGLEKSLLIVLSLIQHTGPAETRIASMVPYVKQALAADHEAAPLVDEATRGGYAGVQQE